MSFDKIEIVRKPAIVNDETDLEYLYRFAIETYKNVSQVKNIISCHEIHKCGNMKNGMFTCKGCKLNVDIDGNIIGCQLTVIQQSANYIMWAIKDGRWRK